MLLKSIEKSTVKYLQKKRVRKGQEIEKSKIKMAEYLMPNYENLSIIEKRSIFEIRNGMVSIPYNFSGKKGKK